MITILMKAIMIIQTDIAISDKKEKVCKIIYFALPIDQNVTSKEHEKVGKYQKYKLKNFGM